MTDCYSCAARVAFGFVGAIRTKVLLPLLCAGALGGACLDPCLAQDALLGEVDTVQLSIRSGPGTNFPSLGALPQGSSVMLFPGETDDGWSQVAASLGGKPSLGWVRRVFIKPLNISNAPPAAKPTLPSPKPNVADAPSPSKTASPPPAAKPTLPSPKPKVADAPSPRKTGSAPPAPKPTPSPAPNVTDVPSTSKKTPLDWVRSIFNKGPNGTTAPPAAGPTAPAERNVASAPSPSLLRPLSVTGSALDCGEISRNCKVTIELTYRGHPGVNGTFFVDCNVSARLEQEGNSIGSNRSFWGSGKLHVSRGHGRTTMTVDMQPANSTARYAAVRPSDVACSHK